MRIFLFFLFLFFSSTIAAQKTAENVVAVKKGSKYQFVNRQTGVPADNNLWDEAEPFVNGFAKVYRNKKFSLVNKSGRSIAPAGFDAVRNFSNKLCAAQKDGKWGFIDETGKAVIPFKYEIAFDFTSPSVTAVFTNKKWYLLNDKGIIINQPDITSFYGFKNNVAKVFKEEKEGMLYTDGKLVFNQAKPAHKPIPWQPTTNNLSVPCPDNIGFEFGDFTNWECFTGDVAVVAGTNQITVFPSPPTTNRHTIIPRLIPSALDQYGFFPTNPPDGSNFGVRLGNTSTGAEAERIRYTIHVPLNDSTFSLKYDYAVVFEDPGHDSLEQPRFVSRLIDSATGNAIACASLEFIATSGLPGFEVSPIDTTVIFKPWSSVFYSLRGYGGQTLYLEFTTADCTRSGHWGYAYVDVQSTCGSPVNVQYDCLPPNEAILTAPPGFQFYNWWNSNYTTLLGTGQQLILNPGPPVGSIIWAELIPFNSFGCLDTLLVKLDGTFDADFDMDVPPGCGAKTYTFYSRNIPSLNTVWYFGDGNTATGDTVTHTYTIPGSYQVTMEVTMPGGCFGNSIQLITIYPPPNMVQPLDQVVCNDVATSDIIFTGTPPGLVFNWTNSDPSIGLPASGSGDILSFTPVNTGTTPVVATIIVTPAHLTCTGLPDTFRITVNPSPDMVTLPADQALCHGSITNAVAFTPTLSGTTFNWTNSNPSIGLAASGSGDIPAFTALNTGSAPVTATITVTPSNGICPGTPRTFIITVNPIANIVPVPNLVACNSGTINAINFSGSVTAATYNWVNTNTSIGLAASGTGDIASFTAVNTGIVPQTALVTVTPSAFGCPTVPHSFIITVNPTPDVAQPADQVVCHGAATTAVNFTGNVSGTGFGWNNTNPSIGLPASGVGDIPSFTAVNLTNTPIVATILVTPSANSCPGTVKIFTITVNPIANIVPVPNIVACNSGTINAINFSGSVTPTTFNWTNTNTSIGLAASGTGNIPAFTAVNTGTVPETALVTVTPSAFGCPTVPHSFIITVNPTPDVTQPADQVVCNGAATTAVNFTGSVSGTGFGWNNSNPSIGLAASGVGDIPSFTAVNLTNSPVVATILVTPSANSCPGTVKIFTITVDPTPNVVKPADQVLCNNALTNAINFTGNVSGSSFSWTNTDPSIGLAAGGSGDIPPFTAVNISNAPVTATITVTPSFNGCPGPPQIFTITVNPSPDVVQPGNQAICNGTATGAINFTGSVSGTSFSWTNDNTSIGLAANGTGDIPSFTGINVTNVAVTATITVTPSANGCTGIPQIFTITVYPTPDIAVPASQVVCNNAATAAINFTGAVSGTIFSWTNNNTSIGLAGSGTGDIPSFTAVNLSNTSVIATISVLPTANGCPGSPVGFTITVLPTPDLVQPANQVVCNGGATAATNFTGSVTGTSFNWVNNNTTIGLAASGTGDIPSFTAVNTTNAPVTATITVTPSANGCTGIAQNFLITVNPTPDVAQPASQVLCNGSATAAINFTGSVSGTGFGWTNDNPSIGLPANGVGDIPSFTAINTNNVPVTATIIVIPSANSCPGAPKIFTITVNPTPGIVKPADQVLCNNAITNAVNFTGPVTGTVYSWVNDNTSIGLAAGGTGDIPSFTAVNTTNVPVTATITVSTSANSCAGSSQTFTIMVNPTPDVAQPTDQRICEGFTTNAINFSGNVSGTNFNWTNSQPSIGLASTGTGNINSFRGINPGPLPVTASITVTPVAKGCVGLPKTVEVRVDPNPAIELGDNLNLSTGTITNLNAVIQNGPIATWAWTPATGLSCTDCPSPELRVTNDITFTAVATNIYGCTARDNISISTFCKNSQVFVPNAFTPDGDGLNDILMVRGKGIFVTNFRIFNRWGELVFQKTNFNPNDKQFGWDGKVRGIPANTDVFVFTAEVVCDNGIKYTYKGNTTLLR
ncbi:MAG: gliding motility-associated C-terminal domain-containing protein [Ferruginibacter sp.]|nr:gliding motility-associated C-terminal domain-containing protein [Ferruginibacter sp.]